MENNLADFDTIDPNTVNSDTLDFAIIGAGIAGLTLANKLKNLGFSLAVFEKSERDRWSLFFKKSNE